VVLHQAEVPARVAQRRASDGTSVADPAPIRVGRPVPLQRTAPVGWLVTSAVGLKEEEHVVTRCVARLGDEAGTWKTLRR
jgi:hypothetical protein